MLFRFLCIALIFFACLQPSFCTSSCEEILGELSKKNESIHTIKANFTIEKYMSIVEGTLESKGTLTFKAPNKFCWETISPERSKFLCDGITIRIYYPDLDEVDEYPLTNYKWLQDLFKDFPMSSQFDVEMLRKKYNTKNDPEFQDQSCHALMLKPQGYETQSSYKLIELILDKISMDIKKIIFYEYDEDKMTIKFSDIVHNEKIDDDFFNKIKSTDEKR
ncbi:outer membrane lipoprotein carrier protein LolA [bacterium]|nr:outer membrane lipoprotein carrier protein LolA [bacterium]